MARENVEPKQLDLTPQAVSVSDVPEAAEVQPDCAAVRFEIKYGGMLTVCALTCEGTHMKTRTEPNDISHSHAGHFSSSGSPRDETQESVVPR